MVTNPPTSAVVKCSLYYKLSSYYKISINRNSKELMDTFCFHKFSINRNSKELMDAFCFHKFCRSTYIAMERRIQSIVRRKKESCKVTMII